MSDEKATLTTKETAELLGVTRAALYKMMDRGELTPLPQDTDVEFPPLQFDQKQVEALKRKRHREGRDKPRRSRTPRPNVEPHEYALI
jgi:predicted DNA-binding transcriptional regulator AlpA